MSRLPIIRHLHPRRLVALALVLLVGLSACGGGSPPSMDASGGSALTKRKTASSGIGGNSISPGIGGGAVTFDSDSGNLLSGSLTALLAKAHVSSPIAGAGTTGSPFSLATCAANQIWKMDGTGTTWGCSAAGGPTIFSVKDYGATGLGVADDRVSIQNAINAAQSAGGGIVYFPPGVYLVSRNATTSYSLKISASNITLQGIRGQSWIKHTTGMPNASVSEVLVDGPVSNIAVYGMGFDGSWGNAVTEVASASDATAFPGSGGPTTINVADASDFPTTSPYTVLVIDSTGTAQSVTCTGKTSTTLTGCSGGSGTMFVHNTIGYVDDNTGINHTTQTDPKNHGLMLRGVSSVLVEDSVFKQIYGDCIWMGYASVDSTILSKNVRIENVDCNISARNAFTIGQNTRGVTVANSVATNIFAQAFDTEPVTQPARDVVIEGTRLGTWFNPGNASRRANSPLSIQGGAIGAPEQSTSARGYRVHDCIIEGSVNISEASDVVLENNRILEDWNGYGQPPIYIFASADDVTIADNYIYLRTMRDVGVASAGILVSTYNAGGIASQEMAPAGVVLRGNRIHARNGALGISVVEPGQSTTIENGTASATSATSLTDGTKSWTTNQWAGFLVRRGTAFATVASNTATVLTLQPLDTPSVGAWETYLGKPTATPGTGTYTIYLEAGTVDVVDNVVDGRDDGNGGGGYGIYAEAAASGTYSWWNGSRVSIRDNIVRDVGVDGIHVKSFTGAPFSFLKITDNRITDDQTTPTITTALNWENTPNYSQLIMRGNNRDGGVATAMAGLSSGTWLVEDGTFQRWAGFGTPSGVVSAPPGSMYQNLSGGASTTSYAKETGTGTSGWAAAASASPQLPAWMSQLSLVGATNDPATFGSNSTTATAGVMTVGKIKVYSTTFDHVVVDVTQAIVGGTHAYIGVYKSDGTQTTGMGTATVDALASLGTTGFHSIALTNAVTVSNGDDVYIAILVTGSPGTPLKIQTFPGLGNGDLASSAGYRSANYGSSLSALPASMTLTSMSSLGNPAWFGIR